MSAATESSPRQAVLLDGGAIRARRVELRMTENQLGRRIGKSAQVVRRIEAGLSHEGLTLRVLSRLSGALGVTTASLVLVPGTEERPPGAAPAEAPMDASLLGALLVGHGGGVGDSALATALGVSLAVLHTMLATLALRLEGTGLMLERSGEGPALVSDRSVLSRLPKGAEQALRRSRPVGAQEAAMLLRVVRGQVPRAAVLDRPRGMILAKLEATGAIELPSGSWAGSNPPKLASAVSFSLMMPP